MEVEVDAAVRGYAAVATFYSSVKHREVEAEVLPFIAGDHDSVKFRVLSEKPGASLNVLRLDGFILSRRHLNGGISGG